MTKTSKKTRPASRASTRPKSKGGKGEAEAPPSPAATLPSRTVGTGHEAEWPDKLVFAALLLLVAGAIGLLYGLLVATGATIGPNLPEWLREYPLWAILSGSAVALVAGWAGFRFQWAVACWIGVAAAGASMAFLGLVPALAAIAVGMLVVSLIEGEKTGFHRRVEAHEWPDKAIMSSLFLTVGGVFTAAQAVAQYAGVFPAFVLPEVPWVWATFSLLASVAMVAGGVQCFRLHGGRTGVVGAVLGIAAAAFYVIGPVLGILALVFIRLANRENEFQGVP